MCIHGIFKNYPRFHSIQRREVMDPKKVEALVNKLVPTTLQQIPNFQWDGTMLHVFYQELCIYYVTNYQIAQV